MSVLVPEEGSQGKGISNSRCTYKTQSLISGITTFRNTVIDFAQEEWENLNSVQRYPDGITLTKESYMHGYERRNKKWIHSDNLEVCLWLEGLGFTYLFFFRYVFIFNYTLHLLLFVLVSDKQHSG